MPRKIPSPLALIMVNFLKNLFDKKPRVQKVDVARRFDLLTRVGQGSMSKVWRARDNMTGRMLAVKVLDKMKTERFEARFVGLKKPSEGQVASSLQHPNIVHTIEHGITTGDEQYLVMEFVEGVSLSYLVDAQNEQMRDNCLNYIIQLGEALDYLHRQNWIHRDVCPRNVMVDSDNMVKLIDFGLVVPNIPDFQKPGNRTGTANYMAPELIKRQRTDQRIDIFSFAVTAYEMLSKRLPWDVAEQETLETVLQHINKPPKPISQFAPHVDSRVAEVIMKGLQSNPGDRWQTMSELLIPLRTVCEEIEAKLQLERKLKAASAKAKAVKTKTTSGAAAAQPQKQKKDDDFFEQIVLGERASKSSKPKSPAKSAAPDPEIGETSVPTRHKPSSDLPAQIPNFDLGTDDKSQLKSSSKSSEPDIVVEDEFDGIEIEVEGHKLDAIDSSVDSSDEFDGIEIEVEGELPVAAETLAKSTDSLRKHAPLLEKDGGGTPSVKPAKSVADDDDEPVLRLPDDD